MSYRLIRPLLFALDAERAHHLSVAALRLMPTPAAPARDPMLETMIAGIRFPNPVGLAAGYDKEGLVAHKMHGLGFGFAELGTLTPLPQSGNPLPRLFRLVEDRAVINRMGFNNGGQAAAQPRLDRLRSKAGRGLVGVNIGANKDAADRVADYATGVVTMAGLADWLTVNISSPNTPGLRALQDEGALDALLAAVRDARATVAQTGHRPPLFLKVAPDLEGEQIDGVVRSAMTHGIDALIVGNTTISRPPLQSRHAGEAGGLSGAPLAPLALQRLRDFRSASGGAITLIAAGGIASADDVWERLCAGASMVQLYSALVYEGPWLARAIARELTQRVEQAGVDSISAIVGSKA